MPDGIKFDGVAVGAAHPLPVQLNATPTIDIGKISITDSGGTNTVALESAGADASSNTFYSLDAMSYLKGYNGSTWDRLRTTTAESAGALGTGLLAVRIYGRTSDGNSLAPHCYSPQADATSNSAECLATLSFNMGYNGSTWDRLRIDANKAMQTTSTLPVTATATLTRPANTTAYAASQQVSATANGGTGSPLSFTLAGVNGGGGVLASAHLIKSSTSTTNATFRLHLFDSAAPTLTSIGDRNTYNMPAIADYAAYVGYFDFNTAVAGADGCWFEGSPSQSILAFLAAGGSKTVYGVLTCTGAYTPTSGEVFDVRLTSLPN